MFLNFPTLGQNKRLVLLPFWIVHCMLTFASEDALAGVQGCTVPPYFEIECNAPPNFGDFVNNVLQMGVQN